MRKKTLYSIIFLIILGIGNIIIVVLTEGNTNLDLFSSFSGGASFMGAFTIYMYRLK